MLIRIGFEISLDCSQETPLLLALSPHPSYGGRVTGSDRIRTEPAVRLDEYLDPFGNRRTRVVAPVGRLTLWSDCIVENDGAPDPYDWNARQHDVADRVADITAARACWIPASLAAPIFTKT